MERKQCIAYDATDILRLQIRQPPCYGRGGQPTSEPVLSAVLRRTACCLRGCPSTRGGSLPEMHMGLPLGLPSEDVPEGSFQNTEKYSYCGSYTKF